METIGIEPTALCMQNIRSPNWATLNQREETWTLNYGVGDHCFTLKLLFYIKTETVGLEPTSHALKRQRSTIKLCQICKKEGGEIRTLDM